jgi:hypothetical protein
LNGLGEWTFNPKKSDRQQGGKLYYGRMLMSHVYEALKIIKEIENNNNLKRALESCDAQTRASFDAVAAFLTSADYNMLERIRHNTGFHYSDKLSQKYLTQIDKEFPNHCFTYTLANDFLDWYFELGDLISDKIVVRDIFKAPANTNVRGAIDLVLTRLQKMAIAFGYFAGHFIGHKLIR